MEFNRDTVKVISFYLPQFHTIDENNKWWGEGYTEWTAVRKAKKMFRTHYQPHIPLNNNYYDLLKKETMIWQADLMKKYGVYGQCFYHYYFGNGRKILEKPAENLLTWNDIDMPFCFCWANETWARSWSNIRNKNEWNVNEEKKSNSSDDGILIKQDYGEEEDWVDHFNYLLPFFKDDRYIKSDGRPIFLIYKPEQIGCFLNMKIVWNEMAHDQGLKDIIFIGRDSARKEYDNSFFQDVFFANPDRVNVNVTDYNYQSDRIIEHALLVNDRTYLCGNTGYDDTPRRGNCGHITDLLDPEIFYYQMKNLLYIADKRNNEFVFVNAWNEWGEGMHLEPDEKFGYGYLEALRNAQNDFQAMTSDEIKKLETRSKSLKSSAAKIEHEVNAKYKLIIGILDKWLTLKNRNINLSSYFDRNDMQRIGVYGLGVLGEHFLSELEDSNISIEYLVDKRDYISWKNLQCFKPTDSLPEVDCLVIIPFWDFEEVHNQISEKIQMKCISIEQIIYDLMRE